MAIFILSNPHDNSFSWQEKKKDQLNLVIFYCDPIPLRPMKVGSMETVPFKEDLDGWALSIHNDIYGCIFQEMGSTINYERV